MATAFSRNEPNSELPRASICSTGDDGAPAGFGGPMEIEKPPGMTRKPCLRLLYSSRNASDRNSCARPSQNEANFGARNCFWCSSGSTLCTSADIEFHVTGFGCRREGNGMASEMARITSSSSETLYRNIHPTGNCGACASAPMSAMSDSTPCPRGPLPTTATRVDRMSRKLHTKVGAAVYAARKGIVEPVIGQIKQARGFRQLFLLRGFAKVQGEWALVCATHNILKLYRLCG
jgi:hypothetical protein